LRTVRPASLPRGDHMSAVAELRNLFTPFPAEDSGFMDVCAHPATMPDVAEDYRYEGPSPEDLFQDHDADLAATAETEVVVKLLISAIDRKVAAQLNAILHHPDFQRLEGTWRGLRYLVGQTEGATHVVIRVLNVSKPELLKDLERAAEFDQSALFKKVY